MSSSDEMRTIAKRIRAGYRSSELRTNKAKLRQAFKDEGFDREWGIWFTTSIVLALIPESAVPAIVNMMDQSAGEL